MQDYNTFKGLAEIANQNIDEKDVFSDARYIVNSCSLICEHLKKGSDVMQLSDGSIIVTETKTFTYKYAWDEKKGKLVRQRDETRFKRIKAMAEVSENF